MIKRNSYDSCDKISMLKRKNMGIVGRYTIRLTVFNFENEFLYFELGSTIKSRNVLIIYIVLIYNLSKTESSILESGVPSYV